MIGEAARGGGGGGGGKGEISRGATHALVGSVDSVNDNPRSANSQVRLVKDVKNDNEKSMDNNNYMLLVFICTF
jgi:hypothetical protein